MTEKVLGGSASDGNKTVLDFVKLLKPSTQYYVRMSGEINTSSLGYKFNIEKYDTDDYSDNYRELNLISIDQTVNGVANHHEDDDYFTFTTDSSNAFYKVDVKVNYDENASYTEISIFSDPEMIEKVASTSTYSGKQETYDIGKALKPSTQYYVKMHSEKDWCAQEMYHTNYQFTIKKIADDVEDTVEKAKAINLNRVYNHKIENNNDVDCFKITTSNYVDYNVLFKSTSSEGNVTYEIFKDKEMIQSIKSNELSGKQALNRNDSAVKLTPYKTYYIKVTGAENSKYTIGINAAAPANNKAKAQTVKKTRQVTISWSKVNKATGYEVYRAVKNGSYKKVATIKSAKTVKWIDKKVKKGYTYKYKVRAYAKVKGKTYYSAYSAEKAVKVK